MTIRTVDDAVIYSEQAAQYFTRADRRVMIGLRAALGLLGIPEPEYAYRRKPGRTPASAVAKAYAADHQTKPSTELAPRKPNASHERVTACRDRTRYRN